MIKILSVEQIRQADAYTIVNEPIASVDLMERAATQCFNWLQERNPENRTFKIFCGTGNNGGDGLVIARLLAMQGYQCEVYTVRFSGKCSDDFAINLNRLQNIPGISIRDIYENVELPAIANGDLVIDAIFGSGLSKPVQGLGADVIEHINNSGAVVISIDIPSGMFAGKTPDPKAGAVIQADYTLSFQFPKLSFLFPESEEFVGDWQILPIGLHPEFIAQAECNYFLPEYHDIAALLKPRSRFAHKGNFGHALLIAGSYGKAGAAVLAAKACLSSGAGLLTAHLPKCAYPIMQTAFPEAMISIDEDEYCFSNIRDLNPYNAIAIGPGLGMDEKSQAGLKLLLQNWQVPLVLDADALNILADNKTWLSFLPPGSVLTPHPREFDRLAGKPVNSLERNELQKQFSKKYNVYVVLKGAFTCISTPDGKCYFNPTGNPGMATGGSGDVLTGIILGLLAQHYTPLSASILGTWVHGLAADIAAEEQGFESLLASDIIEHLGTAFLELYNPKSL